MTYLLIILLFATFLTYSQKENVESSTRILIDKTKFTRINKDWNTTAEFKDKSSEFIFKAKKMTLSYFVYEKDRRITIKLNSYDDFFD